MNMADTYEDRKVARDDWGKGKMSIMLSTAEVTDADYRYETAIAHPSYDGGKIIILGGCDSRKKALAFHAHWKQLIETDTLPEVIADNGRSGVGLLLKSLVGQEGQTHLKETT